VKRRVQELISGAGKSFAPKPGERRSNLPVQKSEPCPAVDEGHAAVYRQADSTARIPLKAGLTLVKIWSTGGEDVESLTQIRSVDKDSVTFGVSAPRVTKGVSQGIIGGERVTCRADLDGGLTYITQAGGNSPKIVPSSTSFSMSASALHNLKTTGTTPMTYIQNVAAVGSDAYTVGMKLNGTLTRLENRAIPFRVLVNEQQLQLPTIHARGKLGKLSAEAYVLDDPANPLMLEFLIDEGNFLELKLVKISYPTEQEIEKGLREQRRVEVYGIYFDFNSDQLRPESEPVLKEIAEALRNNPAWKLSVGGHTDNIGGDAYNLELSNSRAAAVKQTLVERYQIAAKRLRPVGYGASRPKATNDTVEGRALNRRVELMRE
jgi:outer membrane protein OmpA-like peptidoglycan-associated protein